MLIVPGQRAVRATETLKLEAYAARRPRGLWLDRSKTQEGSRNTIRAVEMEVESKEEVERANGSKTRERCDRHLPGARAGVLQNAGTSKGERGAMGRTEWSRMNLEDEKD